MKTFKGLSPVSFLQSRIKNFPANSCLTMAMLCFLGNTSQAAVLPGELIISEVMANPSAVSDTNGEWFELFNPTAATLDLNGLVISDAGSNSHTINESLLLQAGAYLVLGRNGDGNVNGGLSLDYVYSNFTLGNSSDDIFIASMGVQVTALSYDNDGVFGIAGVSAEWLGTAYGPSPGSFSYGDGDIGTPGYQGSYAIPTASAVPVPAAGWLMGSALGTVLIGKNRRRR